VTQKPQKPVVAPLNDYGITDLPPGAKRKAGVPEVRIARVIQNIELLGVRLAWSRACFCPCAPNNAQTQQPDPLCPKCRGTGFFYFGPRDYTPPVEAGELDDVQKEVLGRDGAAVIRGLVTRSTQEQNPYDMLGNWVRGAMFVTVRPENRLGYLDRLINLDAEMVYNEVVEVAADPDDPTAVHPILPVPLRYLAASVNTVQTTDTRYEQGAHFEVERGRIRWVSPALEPGMRLGVHYHTHPVWLVVEHPHVVRETQRLRKAGCDVKGQSHGTPLALPVQAMVQLEFLHEPGQAASGAEAPAP
jgi:hypothetical protein